MRGDPFEPKVGMIVNVILAPVPGNPNPDKKICSEVNFVSEPKIFPGTVDSVPFAKQHKLGKVTISHPDGSSKKYTFDFEKCKDFKPKVKMQVNVVLKKNVDGGTECARLELSYSPIIIADSKSHTVETTGEEGIVILKALDDALIEFRVVLDQYRKGDSSQFIVNNSFHMIKVRHENIESSSDISRKDKTNAKRLFDIAKIAKSQAFNDPTIKKKTDFFPSSPSKADKAPNYFGGGECPEYCYYPLDTMLELGAGTFGKVHLCHLKDDQSKKFAVKVMTTTKSKDNADKLLKEASILENLSTGSHLNGPHPNIVKFIAKAAAPDQSKVFMVTEYVDGNSLQSLIDNEGPYKESDAWPIFMQMASAVRYLHEGWTTKHVHADIKPDNFMITKDRIDPITGGPHVTMLDFGLTLRLENSKSHGASGGGGTTGFQAPEIVLQGHQVVPARWGVEVDCYALGASLYVMLTGKKPVSITSEDMIDGLFAEWEPEHTTESKTLISALMYYVFDDLGSHSRSRMNISEAICYATHYWKKAAFPLFDASSIVDKNIFRRTDGDIIDAAKAWKGDNGDRGSLARNKYGHLLYWDYSEVSPEKELEASRVLYRDKK